MNNTAEGMIDTCQMLKRELPAMEFHAAQGLTKSGLAMALEVNGEGTTVTLARAMRFVNQAELDTAQGAFDWPDDIKITRGLMKGIRGAFMYTVRISWPHYRQEKINLEEADQPAPQGR